MREEGRRLAGGSELLAAGTGRGQLRVKGTLDRQGLPCRPVHKGGMRKERPMRWVVKAETANLTYLSPQ